MHPPAAGHHRQAAPMSGGQAPSEYVFGYGSLLADRARCSASRSQPTFCSLRGCRRAWNVAMDNRLSLPGYKWYRDPQNGHRPARFVTFLNLVPTAGHAVNGVVFAVDAQALASLDDRERNYRRAEVTEQLTETFAGRVWTYVGTPDAEARFRAGRAAGQAVVSREYFDRVLAAFAGGGAGALAAFEASTDAPDCPIVELQRVDLD